MAEVTVSFALQQLTPLLKREVNLSKGAHEEFADIESELKSIRAFLKVADRRAIVVGETSHGVQTWVKKVRKVAFRINGF